MANVVLEGRARIIKAEESRTIIRLSQELVKDSQFPFKAGEDLLVRIEPTEKRLIIEKAPAGGTKKKTRRAE